MHWTKQMTVDNHGGHSFASASSIRVKHYA